MYNHSVCGIMKNMFALCENGSIHGKCYRKKGLEVMSLQEDQLKQERLKQKRIREKQMREKRLTDELDNELEQEFDEEEFDEGESDDEGSEDTALAENREDNLEEQDDEEAKKSEQERTKAFWKEFFSWVRVFVGAFIVAYLISNFVIVNARVPSGSMISTINIGDKVIGFRLSYLFDDPERGDIVMFNAPDKKNTIYIKRVIGLPGDVIEIKNNTLYINGEEQEEKYLKNGWQRMTGTYVYEVPKGEYFMMGDNRDSSNDSRSWGTVPKKEIIAKAIFRYYPSIKSLMK